MKKTFLSLFLLAWTFSVGGASFLTMSDVHFNHNAIETHYGQDTGTRLWNNALIKTKALMEKDKPDFLLVLGDLPAHGISDENRRIDIQKVLSDLRTQLNNRTTPIFLIPGNNDSLYGNYRSFSDKKGNSILQLDNGWPALNAKKSCIATKKPCIINHGWNFRFGYYSAYPLGSEQRLRLIVINSVIFSNTSYSRDDGISQQEAATTEMHWLANELAAAEKAKDAVIIAMHIPPGNDTYQKTRLWKNLMVDNDTLLNRFIALLAHYQNNVRIILAGHTHMDERREIFSKEGNFLSLVISVPSITPGHGNNPSMKIFTYQPGTFTIQDMDTHYTLPNTKTWGNQHVKFSRTHPCHQRDIVTCVKDLRVLTDVEPQKADLLPVK